MNLKLFSLINRSLGKYTNRYNKTSKSIFDQKTAKTLRGVKLLVVLLVEQSLLTPEILSWKFQLGIQSLAISFSVNCVEKTAKQIKRPGMACVLKWLRLEPESARTNDVNLTSLNQYDQIGQFWNVLGANFVSKIAQIYSDNLDYFEKRRLKVKTALAV